MQNFIQGFLPESLMEEWTLSNNLQEDRIQLRNHDDIHTPFARTNFSERLPLSSFPKIWNALQDPSIKIIRNRLELKTKLKEYYLNKLSLIPICTRLLCPRCHLST